jgi:hypothetical protein
MGKLVPETLLLTTLAVAPDQEPQQLSLRYLPEQKEVQFLYGEQPLLMTCLLERVRSSRGSRNNESRSRVERTDQQAIPGGWLWEWLRYGPNWLPKDRLDDGAFVFDSATQLWKNRKYRRRISDAYHDTYYETLEILLTFDLYGLRGWYIEQDIQETED